jgi:hypothetical protein
MMEAGTASEFLEIHSILAREKTVLHSGAVKTESLKLTSYVLKLKMPVIFLKYSYGKLYLLLFLE